MSNRRRDSDRRTGHERRRIPRSNDFPRTPSWEEQRGQHITRYVFWILALIYFNFGEAPRVSARFDLWMVNLGCVIYGLLVTASFLHARHRLFSPTRWRAAMAIDMAITSVSVLVDPLVLSPGFLAFLMVILGNGMRYGLRLFAEAVMGSFLCAMLVLGYRFSEYINVISVGAVFFTLFFIIIVLYSYSLMARLERRKLRLEAERNRDELTGLLNRRALFERAAHLFDGDTGVNSPLVVLFADLDGFKIINDTHGHHMGDRVLTEVGSIISRTVRDSDLAARYGGDEFILILPGSDVEGGHQLARRLQGALNEWSSANDVGVSVSIGLGQAPTHGNDLRTVIERVDQAMYQSKLAGQRGGVGIAVAVGAT